MNRLRRDDRDIPGDSGQSLAGLAAAVNRWATDHGVVPLSGQASREVTVRNLRYYRSLGLLDGPGAGGRYGRKHLLQMVAVRVLQAQGQPLARIRELLFGRTEEELERIEELALAEGCRLPAPGPGTFRPGEGWILWPIDDDHLLLCRGGSRPDPGRLAAIRRLLGAGGSPLDMDFSQPPL